MTLAALRDDALRSAPDGFTLLLGLPWIRSLPLASLTDLAVAVDGAPAATPEVLLDGRWVPASDLSSVDGWWFLQDRLELRGEGIPAPGPHRVSVSFGLMIPYLQAGPDGPLTLPFRFERVLVTDAAEATPAHVSARTGAPTPAPQPALGEGWVLAASAFNVTPEVIRAARPATELAVDLVADRVAEVIELEPGQLWRSFPEPSDAEVDALRRELDAVGGAVSIVGASLDDWSAPGRRRDDEERLAFLLPQLRAAQRVGAAGVRLPIGQAGEPLLRRLLPELERLDLMLLEEIQGQQTPDSPAAAAAIDTIAAIDSPRVRVLVDISMLMPSLPPSYLERLREGGIPDDLLRTLSEDWRDPSTNDAVVGLLREGAVPPAVHTMYMNLLVRFGRSDARVLRGILPLVGAFHLKFWDLDDTDDRVSGPIRDLGALLHGTAFRGTLCSEWGGHEWLDDDPYDITRRHLALARAALSRGHGSLAAATTRKENA